MDRPPSGIPSYCRLSLRWCPAVRSRGLFGDAFATQGQHLELGRWAGPIESGYGLHLVCVRERVDGRVPALAEVREPGQRAWLAARRKEVHEQFDQRLRVRYTVIVEQPQATSDRRPTGAETRTMTEAR